MSAVARRYARALYDLALADNSVERMQRELSAAADAWDTSAEVRAVFENPQYTQQSRKAVMVAIAQRIGAGRLVVNVLSMLADRRRMRNLREIADAFARKVEDASGRVRAEVITAAPLPESYYVELAKVLKGAIGREVTISKKIDPSIIGGVVTRVGDTVFDGSLTHRLQGLKNELLTPSR